MRCGCIGRRCRRRRSGRYGGASGWAAGHFGAVLGVGVGGECGECESVDLSWSAALDNVGVTGYEVERCQGAGCSSFVPVTTVTALAWSDTGRSPGTSYSYRVRARDAAGNTGAYSVVVTAVTPVAPDNPPSAPSGLSASALGSSGVSLSWSAATDDFGVVSYGSSVVRAGLLGVRAGRDDGVAVVSGHGFALRRATRTGCGRATRATTWAGTRCGVATTCGFAAAVLRGWFWAFRLMRGRGRRLRICRGMGIRGRSGGRRGLRRAGLGRRCRSMGRAAGAGGCLVVVGFVVCDDVVGVGLSGGVAVGVADDDAEGDGFVSP